VSIDHGVAEQFVRANWPALAASAWRFHINFGPGALVVEWAVVQRWRRDRALQFHPRYATETDSDDFNAVIRDYDPNTAIVIAFSEGAFERRLTEAEAPPASPPESSAKPIALAAGTALAAMTVTAVPPPPEAHRARGH
jgi:hypothetical protein